MRHLAAGTIVAKDHLSYARVLANSFLEHHPDVPFFTLLADEVDGYFTPASEPFRLLRFADLEIPNSTSFRFRNSQQELTCAATPYLISCLLNQGFDGVAFFKQESFVVDDLTSIFSQLNGHSILLAPHLLEPLAGEGRIERELNILQSGVYNVGFTGVADTPPARAFLAWWQDRVYDHCRHSVAHGMHYEQRWLDLVPAYFDGVHILRDSGFNVGHWNLPDREVRISGDVITVDGQPCRYIRFSGFEPERPQAITKYSPRLSMSNVGPTAALFRRYRTLLEGAGYHESKTWPYSFGHFANGVAIPDIARQMHRALGDGAGRFGDPFQASSPGSYYGWLNEAAEADEEGSRKITRLWRAVYEQRGDVQQAYPDVRGADREGFLWWAARHGVNEHRIPERFLADRVKPKPACARNERKDSDLTFGVNLAGHLASEKGIGEAARSLIRCLVAARVPHALNNFEDPGSANEETTSSCFSGENPHRLNLMCIAPDSMSAFKAQQGPSYFAGRYNLAHWVWELSDFPLQWESYFEGLDEVWVPSSFVQETLSRVSPVPVRVVPYALADDHPAEAADTDVALPADKMIFLFIFDFASSVARKNPHGLVRAFKRAFGSQDDAMLVIKCTRSHLAPAERGILDREAESRRVHIIDHMLSRGQIVSLMRRADCYVSLHRAEGFGLTLAEAMRMGKPVIATGYSGNMHFMNFSNSFPVDYRLIPIDQPSGPYKAGYVWAEPHLGHAAEVMRFVYEHPMQARAVGRRAQEDVLDRLDPTVVGEYVRQLLDEVVASDSEVARP